MNSTEMLQQTQGSTALVEVDQSRAIAEVQASMVIAQRFPRQMARVIERVRQEFTRPSLCEDALYCFSRGGTEISGLNIRSAEVLIRNFGNADYGIREIGRRPGESEMEAFCWDKENNVAARRQFIVPHTIDTKRGPKHLKDARDVYEHTYNMGARRLRAAILAIVPGDLQEAAIQQIEETLKAHADTSPDAIKKLAAAFAEIKVTRQQLERFLSRSLESIRPAQILRLRKIYASIRDEMSAVEDWFDPVDAAATAAANAVAGATEKAAQERKASQEPPPKEPEPEPPAEQQDEKETPVSRIDSRLRRALIKEVDGVGAGVLTSLEEAGFDTAEKIAASPSSDLSKLKNIGAARAQALINFCAKWDDIESAMPVDDTPSVSEQREKFLRQKAEEHGAHWGQVMDYIARTCAERLREHEFDAIVDSDWEKIVRWLTSATQEPIPQPQGDGAITEAKVKVIGDSLRKMRERMSGEDFDKLSDDFDAYLSQEFGSHEPAKIPANKYLQVLGWLSDRQP